jgi:hypothetical protein
MNYIVVLTPGAAEELKALALDLALVVHDFLEQLGQNPAEYGRKPYFPFRPGGLMAECKHRFPDRVSYVRVFFHFGKGETSIIITGFSVQTIET